MLDCWTPYSLLTMLYLCEAELEVSVVEAERLEECLAEQPRVQARQLGR